MAYCKNENWRGRARTFEVIVVSSRIFYVIGNQPHSAAAYKPM